MVDIGGSKELLTVLINTNLNEPKTLKHVVLSRAKQELIQTLQQIIIELKEELALETKVTA